MEGWRKIKLKSMFVKFIIIFNSFLNLVLLSCSNHFEQDKYEIAHIVDSIGNQLIINRHSAVWNYKIIETNGQLLLNIESDQKAGLEHLEEELKSKYPDLQLNVSVLLQHELKAYPFGLINISTGNVRKTPKHNSELITQELMGAPVKVLQQENGWFLIQTPNGYVGWIDAPGISLRSEIEMKNLSNQTFGIFTKQFGQVYKSKDRTEVVSDMVLGNILKITQNLVGFYAVELPDGRKGFIEKEGMISLKSIFNQSKIDANDLVKLAKTFMGVSYLWGGKSSKAIDCSGFTSLIYFFSGIILQRDASQQIKYGELVDTDEGFSNLEIGDLLFFGKKGSDISAERVIHVGMHIGNGEFIHSSGFVRVSSLNQESPNFDNGYYLSFLRAKRMLNCVGNLGVEKIENNELYHYFLKPD